MAPWHEQQEEFIRFTAIGDVLIFTYTGNSTITIDGKPAVKHFGNTGGMGGLGKTDRNNFPPEPKAGMEHSNCAVSFLGTRQMDGVLRTVRDGQQIALSYDGDAVSEGGNTYRVYKVYAA